jgi:ADP-ribosylglycohydrolase
LALYGEAANQVALLSPETAQAIRQTPALHKRDLKTTSATLDTLQVALWAFYRFRDMEDALVTVVNLGGDTDTNGAVTGALFGAKLGDSAIPARWRNALLQEQAIGDRAKALYKLYQQHG